MIWWWWMLQVVTMMSIDGEMHLYIQLLWGCSLTNHKSTFSMTLDIVMILLCIVLQTRTPKRNAIAMQTTTLVKCIIMISPRKRDMYSSLFFCRLHAILMYEQMAGRMKCTRVVCMYYQLYPSHSIELFFFQIHLSIAHNTRNNITLSCMGNCR